MSVLRTIVRFLSVAALVVILLATAAGVGFYYLNTPPVSSADDAAAFTVRPGETGADIAERLEDAGIIRSALFLRGMSRLKGTESSFQAGNYRIAPERTAVAVHDLLTGGNQLLQRVTIPEGWTSRRIAARLEEEGITQANDFAAAVRDPELLGELGIPGSSAEGYLYPDTYMFEEGYPATRVVRHMVTTFFDVLEEVAPQSGNMTAGEIHEVVTLASIVEREYITPEEAPDMASVFYNRLDAGYRLESCATVVYVMTEEEGLPHPSRLLYEDLDRRSPYNTYRHGGLPPGPISNPGRVALDAAFHPSDTDYWFFVLEGPNAREHHFSRSLQEHNEAKVYYLKTP